MATVDSRKRTIAKTVLWRIIATLITWGVVYAFTGKLGESVKITVVGAAVSMLAYYAFERAWNKVRWGKMESNR